jgi:hypothetical protein
LQNIISIEKKWAWWYTPVIPAMQGSVNRKNIIQAGLGKKWDPVSTITRAKGMEA